MARRKIKCKRDFAALKIASVSNSITCNETVILTSVFIHEKCVCHYRIQGKVSISKLNFLLIYERVQGGFISPEIDINSSETTVELSSELTSVEILDYTLAKHINFEAEIRFKEETCVIQVKIFGISLNAERESFYGM